MADLPYSFSFLFSDHVHTALTCMLAGAALVGALRAKDDRPGPDWRWLWAIAALLTIGRWPSLWFPFALNPDESQLLAGAHTLRYDPVFWRSVNGMTSGPLNFYALWPMGTLLGADSYRSAHFTALIFHAIALSAVHLTLSRLYGARVARVARLPTVCLIAFSANADFIHYSTELFPMALVAVAIYLTTRIVFEGVTSAARELAIGTLLGCVPLAKPQAGPIALIVGLALTAWITFASAAPTTGKGARLLRLVGSALVPVTLAGLLVGFNDLGSYVWITFWLNNRAYVEASTMSVFRVGFRLLAKTDPPSPISFVWAFSGLVFFACALPWLKQRTKRDSLFLDATAGFLLVAAICVVLPRRTFAHYVMLLPVPWTLFCGGLAAVLLRRNEGRRLVALGATAALGGTVAVLIALRVAMPYPLETHFSPFTSDFSGRVTAEIKKYARPDDALAIWGWRCEYYVLTGLRQGARDALTETLITPNPYRIYFEDIYLNDLRRSRPAVFVDGVGPGGFEFDDRSQQAHEVKSPAIAAWVREHYVFKADIDGARIYARRDRVEAASVPAITRVN